MSIRELCYIYDYSDDEINDNEFCEQFFNDPDKKCKVIFSY